MTESENTTRKKRIDSKLKSSLLNWQVIPWSNGLDTNSLTAHAVEEYPTKTGLAYYALFVNGKLLGIIEAKRLSIGAGNVFYQAKRYSTSVAKTVSRADIQITKQLKDAGETLGIKLLYHMIFNHKGYYSFLEKEKI